MLLVIGRDLLLLLLFVWGFFVVVVSAKQSICPVGDGKIKLFEILF